MKLHPLATRGIMKLAHASFQKISGIKEFTLFANYQSDSEPPDFGDERSDPFADYDAATSYLSDHAEDHVFLVFGPLMEPDETVLVNALIFVPGDSPISYDGVDFSYDSRFLKVDGYQKMTIHPVRDGKFWEMAEYLSQNAGTDLEDVPEELYIRLSHEQPALESVATNAGSRLSGIEYGDGSVLWSIDAHDPKLYA